MYFSSFFSKSESKGYNHLELLITFKIPSIKKEDFSTKVVIPQILLLLFSHFCVVTGSRPGEMDTPRIA